MGVSEIEWVFVIFRMAFDVILFNYFYLNRNHYWAAHKNRERQAWVKTLSVDVITQPQSLYTLK
jgi:hypothetical protein